MFHLENAMGGVHGGWWLFALLVFVAVLFFRWGRRGRRGNRARNAQFALLRRRSDQRDMTPPFEPIFSPEPPATATQGRRGPARVRVVRSSEPPRGQGETGVQAMSRPRGAIRRARSGESSSPPVRH